VPRHFDFGDAIIYDGQPSYLFGGDIHYFRINPEYWRDRVKKALDCGCNIISVYVPWMVHELAEDDFDFIGRTHPRRNVVGFFELLAEMDVPAIAKPGPFVYSELPGGGVPLWWIKAHREAWAMCWDGERFTPYKDAEDANLSYLHPSYLAGADKWLEAILSVIGPFQRSRGGSIEAVQICNEIGGQHIWLGGYDANPEAIEYRVPGGLYAEFFEAKYGSIDELNKIHDAEYEHFHDVPVPVMGPKSSVETSRVIAADYADFYWNSYIPRYTSWLVDRFRHHGITEKLVTNIAFPEMVVQMRRSVQSNPGLIAGIDLYYTFINNKILGPRNISYCCEYGSAVLASVAQAPPIAFEFQAGAPNELEHEIYGPYAYIWALWSLIGGYKGLNLYVIAGGNNLPRSGAEGTTYDYRAPISAAGELRDTYYGFQRAFYEAKSMEWLLDSELCTDVTIAVCDQPGFRDNAIRGVCEGLFRNGFSYDVLLLDEQDAANLALRPVLWVTPGLTLSRDDQMKLAAYAREGGTLILYGEPPIEDLHFQPCNALLDELSVTIADAAGENRPVLFKGQEIGATCRELSGPDFDTVITSLPDGSPSAAAFNFGKGRVVIAPFELDFGPLINVRVFRSILDAARVRSIAKADRARVLVRKTSDGRLHWFALNYHPVRFEETITVAGVAIDLVMEPYSVAYGEV